MSGSAREKTQADFDLERFINMFDDALTSTDPRVKNALQNLMMMVILTESDAPGTRMVGPLRQLYEDVHTINRRLHRVEDDVQDLKRPPATQWPAEDYSKYTMKTAALRAQSIDDDAMHQITQIAQKNNTPGLIKR